MSLCDTKALASLFFFQRTFIDSSWITYINPRKIRVHVHDVWVPLLKGCLKRLQVFDSESSGTEIVSNCAHGAKGL